MATTNDGRSHNQPSHEAQVKGGQNSHKGTSGSGSESEDTGSESQPSKEDSTKGGQHSHANSHK